MTFSDDRIDYDPKVVQPYFLCGWCHKTHNGDCEEDMNSCKNCAHSWTYHGLARDKEGYPAVQCASWGCDCPGWVVHETKRDKPEDKPVWNT